MADQPDAAELQRCHRWFAVDANNAAWPLAETAARTAEQDAELLDLAHTAAHHWAAVGTPLHRARAEVLLALVHAQLGHAATARTYAASCRPVIEAAGPDPWEVALLSVMAAAVAASLGDSAGHRAAWDQARQQVDALADPQDRAIVQASLDRVPPPG